MGREGEPIPEVKAPEGPKGVINVPQRLLMGPGPANANPRVLAAQCLPLLGHMHPPFFKIMDEIQAGLRYLFQTESKYTCLMSGTGHAGMEACISNLLEPGETFVVGDKGIWGLRVADIGERFGAKVVHLKKDAGHTFSYDELKEAVEKHKPAALFLCQGDSSTGVHQNLSGLGELCHKNGTLLIIDTVCTLGGVPFFADAWGIDAMYSGSQKVIGAPPGASPLFFSQRAVDKLKSRKTKPISFCWDLNLVGDYWGWYNSRSYHHTGMVSTWYAMREALAVIGEDGLENLWEKHQRLHNELWAGLKEMGLEPFVEDPAERLVTVNCIKVPPGVDWKAVIDYAMDTYNLEIWGGLGQTVGKIWRVGIMGYNATPGNVELVLAAFREALKKQGKLPDRPFLT
ncbi:hypothetical protein WJX81_008023 [Elliptochloris bilobata]|uniref:alanine--glyoxylate transaminase n=1 Tax=Elliptochloris bilobata TaxID=381761 RepID=A0AAW1S994_9CHLO